MHTYEISVIIPVYNVENYLRKCLDSVHRQTFKNLEIIIVNDGSTDSCTEIIHDYAKRDDRIVIIEKKNSGYGQSVNMGINIARGKYIAILEPDDYIDSNMYEELYAIAKEEQVDFIKSDYIMFWDSKGNIREQYTKLVGNDDLYEKVFSPKNEPDLLMGNIGTWTALYNKAFLNRYCIRHNETPDASFQDQGFCMLVYAYSTKAYISRKAYYHYRQDNPNSSMLSKNKTFCIFDELSYVYSRLATDKLTAGNYFPIYMKYKYKIYVNRLANASDKTKDEIFNRFANEFLAHKEKKELENNIFSRFEKLELNQIIKKNQIILNYMGLISYYLNCNEVGIWIYGAGKIAQKTYNKFSDDMKKRTKAFLVSSLSDNSDKTNPVPIKEYHFEIIPQNDIIIIGVSHKFQEQIEDILKKDPVNYITLNEMNQYIWKK